MLALHKIHLSVPKKCIEAGASSTPERQGISSEKSCAAQQSFRPFSCASDGGGYRNAIGGAELRKVTRLTRDITVQTQLFALKDDLTYVNQSLIPVNIQTVRWDKAI